MDKEIKEQRPPYARTVFILGFLSVTIGMVLFGLLGIIGVILARKGMKAFEKNPELYSMKGYKTLTRGFYMSVIGSTYVLTLLIFPILLLFD
jgi:F0F1-type ATP synthase membrane subunit c/vacuolar-type H+-ATPase subunit K